MPIISTQRYFVNSYFSNWVKRIIGKLIGIDGQLIYKTLQQKVLRSSDTSYSSYSFLFILYCGSYIYELLLKHVLAQCSLAAILYNNLAVEALMKQPI